MIVDVLFANNHYAKLIKAPLRSLFLLSDGTQDAEVDVPAPDCLLGDKLTAFAPHTIGVSFFNETFSNDKRLEVIKQFYDVAQLFEVSNDFALVRETYLATAKDEIAYRGIPATYEDCLEDSFQSALCILTWGKFLKEDFPNFVKGFRSIANHLVGEKINPNNAYLPAAKVMLLCACIKANVDPFSLEILRQPLFDQAPFSLTNKIAKLDQKAFDIAATAIRINESKNLVDPNE